MPEDETLEPLIEEWMLSIVQNGGIERFDDLHIDRIDRNWRSPPLWIEGGLASFQAAVRLRDRHKLPVQVVLGFSLQADEKRTGIDFNTLEEFVNRLNWMPPSLYLFPDGIDHALQNEKAIQEGHVCADAVVKELGDPNLFGKLKTGQRTFYQEFKRTDETEYCRSVLLQG